MKYIGLDFGEKRIGIAISDENGTIAFPHSVVPNNQDAVKIILDLVEHVRAGSVVIGDTKTGSGEPNNVTHKLKEFIEPLTAAGCTITTVPELGSTGAARAVFAHAERAPRGEVQSPVYHTIDNLDAQAAAVILQRYLDIHKR